MTPSRQEAHEFHPLMPYVKCPLRKSGHGIAACAMSHCIRLEAILLLVFFASPFLAMLHNNMLLQLHHVQKPFACWL